MSATVRLEWPIADWPNSNRDRKKHWTREREEARNIRATAKMLGLQAMFKVDPIPSPVQVALLWAFPDNRERDLENWSSKALLDGIADSGLIQGDSTKHIRRTVRDVDPERSPKGQLRVTVTITEMPVGGVVNDANTWEDRGAPQSAQTPGGPTRVSGTSRKGPGVKPTRTSPRATSRGGA